MYLKGGRRTRPKASIFQLIQFTIKWLFRKISLISKSLHQEAYTWKTGLWRYYPTSSLKKAHSSYLSEEILWLLSENYFCPELNTKWTRGLDLEAIRYAFALAKKISVLGDRDLIWTMQLQDLKKNSRIVTMFMSKDMFPPLWTPSGKVDFA